MSRTVSRIWAVSAAILALALLICALSAGFPHYSVYLRAAGLYCAAGFSYVFSFIPFAASELVLLLILPAIAALFAVKMRKHGAKRGALRAARALFCVTCVASLLFSLNLGVQYGAPPLSSTLGLYVGRYTARQLDELCAALLERANYYAERVPRDGAGDCDFGDFASQSRATMAAYRELAADTGAGFDFSVFSTPRTAAPKAALLSVPMSYLGIAGYYFPWTAEAVVSVDTIDADLPFTIAHEAAHGHGVAAEDEANFAAFLACSRSGDARLNYSAYFNAYIYATNALYGASYELWAANAAGRGELLQHDLMRLNEHLAKYATPVRDAGEAVNNAYIKATGQPEGVRTYGKVVDLLLAWHFAGDVSGDAQ